MTFVIHKSYSRKPLMNYSGEVGNGLTNDQWNFGGDPDPSSGSKIFSKDFYQIELTVIHS